MGLNTDRAQEAGKGFIWLEVGKTVEISGRGVLGARTYSRESGTGR